MIFILRMNFLHKMSFSEEFSSEDTGVEFCIYSDILDKEVCFTSHVIFDNEMFDLTTLASYYGKSNSDIVKWFNSNLSTLKIIDTIITGDVYNDNTHLQNLSDDSLIKINDIWYVNLQIVIEFLFNIDKKVLYELITACITEDDCDNVATSMSDYIAHSSEYDEYEYDEYEEYNEYDEEGDDSNNN